MSALMEIELANAARLDKFDARIAALELRSDVLQAVLSLCEMAVNPAAIKARVLELRRQADQARDLQAKLTGERAAFDRDKAEFDAKVEAFAKEKAKLEADLKASRAEIGRLSDQINAEANKAFRARNPRPPCRTVRIGAEGSTLAQEHFDDPPVRDAHYHGATV